MNVKFPKPHLACYSAYIFPRSSASERLTDLACLARCHSRTMYMNTTLHFTMHLILEQEART